MHTKRISRMVQRVMVLATKSHNPGSINLGPTRLRASTDFFRLSTDLHTYAVMPPHMCVHT